MERLPKKLRDVEYGKQSDTGIIDQKNIWLQVEETNSLWHTQGVGKKYWDGELRWHGNVLKNRSYGRNDWKYKLEKQK